LSFDSAEFVSDDAVFFRLAGEIRDFGDYVVEQLGALRLARAGSGAVRRGSFKNEAVFRAEFRPQLSNAGFRAREISNLLLGRDLKVVLFKQVLLQVGESSLEIRPGDLIFANAWNFCWAGRGKRFNESSEFLKTFR
jgi:hypothetical protein